MMSGPWEYSVSLAALANWETLGKKGDKILACSPALYFSLVVQSYSYEKIHTGKFLSENSEYLYQSES